MSAEEQCALCFLVLSLFCPEVLAADLCYSSAFFHLWPTSFFVETCVSFFRMSSPTKIIRTARVSNEYIEID